MQDHSQHPAEKTDDHTQHAIPQRSGVDGAMNHSMHKMEDHSAHNDHQGHVMPASKEMGHKDHSTHTSHDTDHSGHEQMFRIRFWWSLLLSIPVLAYSGMLLRMVK